MPLELLAHSGFLGTLPGWLAVGGVVALAIALRGGQLGPAVGYLREANEALTRERGELRDKLSEERKENAALRVKTDLEPLQVALVHAIEQHEESSAKRDEHVLAVLDLIADRLGPEHE